MIVQYNTIPILHTTLVPTMIVIFSKSLYVFANNCFPVRLSPFEGVQVAMSTSSGTLTGILFTVVISNSRLPLYPFASKKISVVRPFKCIYNKKTKKNSRQRFKIPRILENISNEIKTDLR